MVFAEHGKHPVARCDKALCGGGDEKSEKVFSQIVLLRCFGDGGEFDLHELSFGKERGSVVVIVFGDRVIGGRGCVAEHHIGFALQEESVGFAPTFGYGDDSGKEDAPDFGSLVSVDFFDPQQQPQPRRAGARVLDDEAQVCVEKFVERLRRRGNFCFVVDEGEPSEIEGHEKRVGPGYGQVEEAAVISAEPVRSKESFRLSAHVVVDADDEVGGALVPFYFQRIEKRSGVFKNAKLQLAVTAFFVERAQRSAQPSFGGKRVVGIDGERSFLCVRKPVCR